MIESTLREFIKDLLNPTNTQQMLRERYHGTKGLNKLLKDNIPVLKMFGFIIGGANDYIYVEGPSVGLYVYKSGDVWV